MFQTHPPFAERIAANVSFLAQHPHASDKEDEVTHATPVVAKPKAIDLSIPYQPFADLPKSNLTPSPWFSDIHPLRIGTPVGDQLRGH